MQSSSSPEEDAVAAFYARVMQRVCTTFHEIDPKANADVAALIETKWRQRLSCYTGIQWQESDSVSAAAVIENDAQADVLASGAGIRTTVASGVSTLVDTATPAPQAVSQIAHGHIVRKSGASQSVFAKMLGAKRKISQLDGVNDDDEDEDSDRNDTATTENPDLSGSPCDDSVSQALTTSSSEVAAVLNPVWGLLVSDFPAQLSARSSRFRFRNNHRDFYGKLSAIVLTLTRPLRPRDVVHPGHLLWLHAEGASSDASARKVGMVEVVALSGERLDEIHVKLADGTAVTVNKASTMRFYEFIIEKGVAQLEALR